MHTAKVLGLAQEMAARLTGKAKAEADGMVSEARTHPLSSWSPRPWRRHRAW